MEAKLGNLNGGAITSLHSDGAHEYVELQINIGGGIPDISVSAPYTPERNAIAERINRTIAKAARSLPIQAELPCFLWPFALNHVLYIPNRLRHSIIDDTSFRVLMKTKHNYH